MDPMHYNPFADRKSQPEERFFEEHRRDVTTHKMVGDELSLVSKRMSFEDGYFTARRLDTELMDWEVTTPRPRYRSATGSVDPDATAPKRVSVFSQNSHETSLRDSVRSTGPYGSIDNPTILDEAGHSLAIIRESKTALSPPTGGASLHIGIGTLLTPSTARLHPRIKAKFSVKKGIQSARACKTVPPKLRGRVRDEEGSPLLQPYTKMRRALNDLDVRDALTTSMKGESNKRRFKLGEGLYRRASANAVDRMWCDYHTINNDHNDTYKIPPAVTPRYKRRVARRGA